MRLHSRSSNCEPANPSSNLTDRLNKLLNSSGPDYTLSLCPSQQYVLTAPLLFAAPNQEISTAGYPTDSTRATLVVAGPIVNGTGHTTAVDGTCSNCHGIKLRNVQVNGTRLGAPQTIGGANIEMGGPNANQLIEFVHSYDPRGWSCLHLNQGSGKCTGATVQNSYIGPAGSDAYRQWADGISVACRNSVIRNNLVNNPTDGGIVLFGAPGTRVENNTIWVETHTLLGGINLVDFSPYKGDYRGVVVTNNTIAGGFASHAPQGSEMKGTNDYNAIIKIGIAIGPRTWFGHKYGGNVSTGAIVQHNQLTGAFAYGIAMGSATNFTVDSNVLVDSTSFIGERGPNCTSNNPTPTPADFVLDLNKTHNSATQFDFEYVSNGDSLTCVIPPNGGALWPLASASVIHRPQAYLSMSRMKSSHGLSTGMMVGIIIAAIAAVLLIAGATWFVRKRTVKRSPLPAWSYPKEPPQPHASYMRELN